jgi:phage gpG-like protein
MQVRITSYGFEFIESSLRASAGRAKFLKPALEEISLDMMHTIDNVFDSQGRRGSGGQWRGSWQALKKDTILRKVKSGGDPRILFDTGEMHASLTHQGDENMDLRIGRFSVFLGSKLGRAEVHQDGSPVAGIPARPFIVFGPADQTRWGEIIISYIIDPMRRRA